MPRLLALREEGALEKLLQKWTKPLDTKRINELAQQTIERNKAARKKGREQEWLKAVVPALDGPFAGEAWIKHVLRPLVEAGYVA